MSKGFEVILSLARKRARYIKNWRIWVSKIARAAKELLPDAEVYVFGSAVKEELSGGSDIDVLIVSDKVGKKAELRVKIYNKLKLPLYHPFELHIVNRKEAKWYFKNMDRYEKID